MSTDRPTPPPPPRLRQFVQQFSHLLDSAPDEPRVLREGGACWPPWWRTTTGCPPR
jgi:hypothetical protein